MPSANNNIVISKNEHNYHGMLKFMREQRCVRRARGREEHLTLSSFAWKSDKTKQPSDLFYSINCKLCLSSTP